MRITHNEIRRHPAWRDELAAPVATPAARQAVVFSQTAAMLAVAVIVAVLAMVGWLAR